MSSEINSIKELWASGEVLSLKGSHPEALLNFQRAKSMLLIESKSVFGVEDPSSANNSGGSKLMGDILSKLTVSINRDVKLINANPVHALGLKRGYNKSDVKKAYRAHALKYHPDKNQDCDTSSIFAAIQSSYEKLNAAIEAVPDSSKGSTNSKVNNTKESPFYSSHKDMGRRGTGQSPYEFDQSRPFKSKNSTNNDANKSSNGSNRDHNNADTFQHPKDVHRNKNTKSDTKPVTASTVSNMTTDHLKVLLKQFGFGEAQVDKMQRAELIKKFLAVSSHLGSKSAPGGSKKISRRESAFRVPSVSFHAEDMDFGAIFDDDDDDDDVANGSGLDGFEQMAQMWAEEWGKQMKEELQREHNSHKVTAKVKQSKQINGRRKSEDTGYEFTHIPADRKKSNTGINTGAAPTPSPYASTKYTDQQAQLRVEEKLAKQRIKETKSKLSETRAEIDRNNNSAAEDNRKHLADALRAERATWMADKIPSMSLSELKRIIEASGLIVESDNKHDLVNQLSRHYGINIENSEVSGIDSASREFKREKKINSKKNAVKAGMTPAEAALKSKLGNGADLPSLHDNRTSVKSENNRKLNKIMDNNSLKNVVQASTGENKAIKLAEDKRIPSSDMNSNFITREKLKELEKRVLGNGKLRGEIKHSDLPSLNSVIANAAKLAVSENLVSELSESSNPMTYRSTVTIDEDDEYCRDEKQNQTVGSVDSSSDEDSKYNEDSIDFEDEEDDDFIERLRQKGWDLAALKSDSTKESKKDLDKSKKPHVVLSNDIGLGSVKKLDEDQRKALEKVLDADNEGEHVDNPALAPGRIRATRKSGNLDDSVSKKSNSEKNRSNYHGLSIDLSALKNQSPDIPMENKNVTTKSDAIELQEEVDFWVQSARSDQDGRRTYRELGDEFDNNGNAENKKIPRAVSPIISPKLNEDGNRGFLFFG